MKNEGTSQWSEVVISRKDAEPGIWVDNAGNDHFNFGLADTLTPPELGGPRLAIAAEVDYGGKTIPLQDWGNDTPVQAD
jgi:hypothetical protein